MRARCRVIDWAATPLGPVQDWPTSLHVLIRTMLATQHPMFLWWGPSLIQFYNDAYRPSLGEDGRHERALGASGPAFWSDIWHIIGPEIAGVMVGGEATWHEDQLVPIARNGRTEEVWWTYSYSPAFDDAGEVHGVLVICQETTRRFLADRERERLRAETMRAEQHAARILAQVKDAHVSMDAAFRLQSLNGAAERATGKSLTDVEGRTHWELFPDSVGTEIERQYRRVMTERTEAHFAHHYVGGGYNFHVEIDAYPTDDGGLAVFWRDVSERVQAGDDRRAMDAQYRALFDAIDAGFCTLEIMLDETGLPSDCRYLEVNPAFAVQTGLVGAVGRTAREMVPGLEDVWIERYGHVAASGESARFQLGSDALGRWFDAFAFRVGQADERRVGVLFTDITEAKRAEREREALLRVVDAERARLFDIFKTAPAFLAILRGPTHIFDLVNDAYYQLIGHRDIIGKSVADAVPETVEQGFIGLLDHVRVTGEPFIGRELRVVLQRRLNGPLEERFLDFVYTPFVEQGVRVGVVAHGYDVTEQVRSRRDVERLRDESEAARLRAEQAEAELSEADRRKDEFLATLAHELRNPLAPLRNGLELMKLASGQVAAVEQTRCMMERQLTQMVRLVDDLMDISRISRGQLELRTERVALADVLISALETSRPLIEQMGHELTVTVPEHPITVDADMTRLPQVFLNLLNNAAKYSGRGGHIYVDVERHGSDVEVRVTDTGIGIAADQLPRIFEMFRQVDRSLEKSHGGLGIGLALARRLAEMHGGSVEARSEGLGQGSEFVVRLPVVDEALTSHESGDDEEHSATTSLRILIVDDNRDGADSLAVMLRIVGNDVRTAYDGQEGMDEAGSFRPDVIFFDIGLPKMNGYDACRRIRQQPWGKDIVMIAVTGWGQDADRRRSHDAGFDHHLVKPVEPTALVKLLAGLRVAKR